MGILYWWRNLRRRRLTPGEYWERQAERYLKAFGLKTLYRNHRTIAGEIDLVMRDGKSTVVFVEVRYRHHGQRANALESVTWHKQQKIIKATKQLMCQKKWHNRYHARFDVVAIQGTKENPTIEWIKNAFD